MTCLRLTGWAQVNGRNDSTWNQKFELAPVRGQPLDQPRSPHSGPDRWVRYSPGKALAPKATPPCPNSGRKLSHAAARYRYSPDSPIPGDDSTSLPLVCSTAPHLPPRGGLRGWDPRPHQGGRTRCSPTTAATALLAYGGDMRGLFAEPTGKATGNMRRPWRLPTHPLAPLYSNGVLGRPLRWLRDGPGGTLRAGDDIVVVFMGTVPWAKADLRGA